MTHLLHHRFPAATECERRLCHEVGGGTETSTPRPAEGTERPREATDLRSRMDQRTRDVTDALAKKGVDLKTAEGRTTVRRALRYDKDGKRGDAGNNFGISKDAAEQLKKQHAGEESLDMENDAHRTDVQKAVDAHKETPPAPAGNGERPVSDERKEVLAARAKRDAQPGRPTKADKAYDEFQDALYEYQKGQEGERPGGAMQDIQSMFKVAMAFMNYVQVRLSKEGKEEAPKPGNAAPPAGPNGSGERAAEGGPKWKPITRQSQTREGVEYKARPDWAKPETVVDMYRADLDRFEFEQRTQRDIVDKTAKADEIKDKANPLRKAYLATIDDLKADKIDAADYSSDLTKEQDRRNGLATVAIGKTEGVLTRGVVVANTLTLRLGQPRTLAKIQAKLATLNPAIPGNTVRILNREVQVIMPADAWNQARVEAICLAIKDAGSADAAEAAKDKKEFDESPKSDYEQGVDAIKKAPYGFKPLENNVFECPWAEGIPVYCRYDGNDWQMSLKTQDSYAYPDSAANIPFEFTALRNQLSAINNGKYEFGTDKVRQPNMDAPAPAAPAVSPAVQRQMDEDRAERSGKLRKSEGERAVKPVAESNTTAPDGSVIYKIKNTAVRNDVLVRFNAESSKWEMCWKRYWTSSNSQWVEAKDFKAESNTASAGSYSDNIRSTQRELARINGMEAPVAPPPAPGGAPTGTPAPSPGGAPAGGVEAQRLPGGQEFTSGGKKYEMAFDGAGVRLRYRGVTYDLAANGKALRNFVGLSQSGEGMSAKMKVNVPVLGERRPDATMSGQDIAALLAALEAGGAGPKSASVRFVMDNAQDQLRNIPDNSVKAKLEELGSVVRSGNNWICTSPLTLTPKT